MYAGGQKVWTVSKKTFQTPEFIFYSSLLFMEFLWGFFQYKSILNLALNWSGYNLEILIKKCHHLETMKRSKYKNM